MDVGEWIIIIITAVVHLIGIGLFLVWMAVGRPTSIEQWRRRRSRL